MKKSGKEKLIACLTICIILLVQILSVGVPVLAAETFTTLVTGLNDPMCVAVGSSGLIYFTDRGGLHRANADGSGMVTLDSDSIYYYGVAVNDQYIFYTDTASDSVLRMDLDGSDLTVVCTYPVVSFPAGLALDGDGRVYVASANQNSIKRMDADGSNVAIIGSGFSYPYGVAISGSNHIFVIDSGHNIVKRMELDGSGIVSLGSGLDNPMGIAVDSSENIYVADTGNDQVKRMDPDGGNITNIGTGYRPWGVCTDADDALYITDDGISTGSIIKRTDSVTKLEQTAPAAPTTGSKTATSVTLNTITGAEYRVGSGAWQSSPTFTGLSVNTEYTFYARMAETSTHLASPSSTGTVIRTNKLAGPAAPSAPTTGSKTATSVTLNTIAGAEYRVGSGAWQSSPEFTGLSPNTEYVFYARIAETGSNYASAISTGLPVRTDKLPAPAAPAAPTLGSKTTTRITLATVAGAEYRMGTGEWQSSPVFSSLQPGTAYTFTIRLAETQTALASAESQSLSVTTYLTDDEIPVTGEQDNRLLACLLICLALAAAGVTFKVRAHGK